VSLPGEHPVDRGFFRLLAAATILWAGLLFLVFVLAYDRLSDALGIFLGAAFLGAALVLPAIIFVFELMLRSAFKVFSHDFT